MKISVCAIVAALSLGVAATAYGQESSEPPRQSTIPAEATYEDGMEAYLDSDYPTALSILQPLADQGDARAQYRIGMSYKDGKGVTPDDVEAAYWFGKAAVQGLRNAQTELGVAYATGSGVEQDSLRAYMWFTLSLPVMRRGRSNRAQQAARLRVLRMRENFIPNPAPQLIEEAQAMVERCRQSNYQDCD
jgi:TPR repeat protein